jgi:hypothetical protein
LSRLSSSRFSSSLTDTPGRLLLVNVDRVLGPMLLVF